MKIYNVTHASHAHTPPTPPSGGRPQPPPFLALWRWKEGVTLRPAALGIAPGGGEHHVFARAIAPGPTGEGRGASVDPQHPVFAWDRGGSNPKAHKPAGWRGPLT